MKKFVVLMVVVILLSPLTAFALNMTFFGEDLGPLTQSSPRPNSDAARDSFLALLTGVGTEDFEGFPAGPSTPSTIDVDFGVAGVATLVGDSDSYVRSGTNAGRFPISGENYWRSSSGNFTLNFSNEIAAFGFYGTDLGDFAGNISLNTSNGAVINYDIPHTINAPNASVVYWGVINTDNPFTSVSFQNTGSGVDRFGFDDFTIGSVEQVQPVIPEPGTVLLLSTGLISVFVLGRKKLLKKK
jgi:hypothetical protein